MTEKSEDQVVWVELCNPEYGYICPECGTYAHVAEIQTSTDQIPYIPHSKYLALEAELNSFKEVYSKDIKSYIVKSVDEKSRVQSKLELAVKALNEIHENYKHVSTGDLMNVAKEALGKIGEK